MKAKKKVIVILFILIISLFISKNVDISKQKNISVNTTKHKIMDREKLSKSLIIREVDFSHFEKIKVNIVDDYGAIANDNKDDWKAIQSALNRVKNNGGGTVIIPNGTFELNHSLKIYKNTRLSLSKDTIVNRNHRGALIINGDVGATYRGYNGNGNILVEGGTYLMNKSSDKALPGGWFGIARAKGIIIRNTVVKNLQDSHAIDLNSSQNVLIDNVKFLGYRDSTEDHSKDYIEAIQIANHTQKGFMAFGEFDGKHTEKVTVQNCTFSTSDTDGFTNWPVGVGNHGYGILKEYNKDIKIRLNHFNNMTMAGIHFNAYQNVIIEGNEFINNQRGVSMETPVRNYTRDALIMTKLQAGQDITISDNTFRNTKMENVIISGYQNEREVAEIKNIKIVDNYFIGRQEDKSKGYTNIRISLVNNMVIKNNLLSNIDNNVDVVQSTSVTIENNR